MFVHVCVSSSPWNLLQGTGKGSHREVNGPQDKGQSCWEKESPAKK